MTGVGNVAPSVRLLAGSTVRVYFCSPVSSKTAGSLAWMKNVADPVVVGVPLSTPVRGFSDSHDGRPPNTGCQVADPEPPDVSRVIR